MGAHLLKPLDLYTLPLSGVQLVEASAGTGKTWTIAGLYVRLLLETPETIDRLLVVTFTKAATAELRDRLRARLVDVQSALRAGQSDDPFCQWALARFPAQTRVAGEPCARDAALEKLALSLRLFDEAAIHTIHAFCQRVLGDAQLPALLGEPDIVPDEREWLPGLVQEAWIRHCKVPLLADLLSAGNLDAVRVQRDIEVLLLKPHLDIAAPVVGDVAALEQARHALHRQWQQEGDAIRDDIRNADALSRAKDQYKFLDDQLAELDAWLAGDIGLGKALRKLTPPGFAEKKKQKGRLPQHAFWEALQDWFEAADRVVTTFRQALIVDVRAALVAHKQAQGLVSYQDLLGLLALAVEDPRLAEDIRSRYGAALIDEFQDTDPLQFRIFARLFAGVPGAGKAAGQVAPPLYLVGDPKQAIYSFRGADIFTYLRARQSAEGRYTLGTNRRSLPPLVEAVNGLFTQHSNPFLFSDLPFPRVDAVASQAELMLPRAPFHCGLLPESDKPMSKETARDLSVRATVAEIVRLLQGAAAGSASIDGVPLRPGDIAVLVPKHKDGRAVTEALAAAGVPAVIRSQDSVFATTEARDMLAVLEAVAMPGREGRVKAAFLSPLMGGTVEALQAAQESDADWSALIGQLLDARECWHQQGFMPMWEGWLTTFAVYERVLGAAFGERRLTNLRHLATLLQQQADVDPVPERQLDWLREQVRNAESTEATQLRLESDAERVQVLTIHVSKGLEYPVVFCPFLWDGSLLHKSDADRAEYRAGDKTLLDIGTEKFAHAQTRMATERLAEKLRVLYVALTRAKYRCYGLWGRVKDSETAPFSWLLLGGNTEGDPDADTLSRAIKTAGQADYVAALEKMQRAVPEGFAFELLSSDIPPLTMTATALPDAPPVVPDFTRHLARRWRVSSFTGLSERAHERHAQSESPDHDAPTSTEPSPLAEVVVSGMAVNDIAVNDMGVSGTAVSDLLNVPGFSADLLTASAPVLSEETAETLIDPASLHAFPRGARAGVFWHAVLEDCVGSDAVLPRAEWPQAVADRLQEHALPPEWLPLVVESLPRLLDTPLDAEGARLGHLDSARAEMEFLYPVQQLRPERFLRLPDVPPLYREALQALDFPVLQGFLKGFIDLIYRHDGRYYVLDYKTNWLGPDDKAYTAAAMEAAMAGSHYYLQYWLYVLALHRHLQVSLPGYDYDRDMGGVRYFFLRGIGAHTHGVYARKPSLALIEALDALMRGHEVAGEHA
ncbi:MAG: exodeoxyribonuclease V subunit beta [Moraxellaceae bacterium]|nr:exodeoxyribonuclease V subunit beta [Moraxellaceae bacterium]